jgi:hypothetical protein
LDEAKHSTRSHVSRALRFVPICLSFSVGLLAYLPPYLVSLVQLSSQDLVHPI